MSTENFFIANPKNNNVDLEVLFKTGTGQLKRYAVVHPGETFRCEKKDVTVREMSRPLKLELGTDGRYKKDSGGEARAAQAKRVHAPQTAF